jgi:hypothetical protein
MREAGSKEAVTLHTGSELRDCQEHRVAPGDAVDASTSDALARLISATERTVADRIDLTKLEAQHAFVWLRSETESTVARALRRTAFVGSGLILAVGGWFMLMGALIMLLSDELPLQVSIAIVGGGNLLLALGLVRAGAHTGSRHAPQKERLQT